MHEYVLKWKKPAMVLRHGGPRPHRRVALFIDGKKWDEWGEDEPDTNYSIGRYFDDWIKDEVKHLRKFFPGNLTTKNKHYRDNT